MTQKEKIFKNLQKNSIEKTMPLPVIENFGIVFEDKVSAFKEAVSKVGAEVVETNWESLELEVTRLYPDAKNIANLVDSKLASFDSSTSTPHELRDLDLSIIKGHFGVAENGAIWVQEKANKHPVLYAISENLIVVLSRNDLCSNMHEAYQKISFEQCKYGVFISGPSKTADIEQSLVIGAHGAKSLYIFLVD